MRLNSLLVSLLVLSTLLYEAQGIRLGKISLSSAPNNEIQEKGFLVKASVKSGTAAGKAVICKDAENNCSSGTMMKSSSFSRVNNKESHHWFPKIHEDYYGMNRKLMAKTTSSTSTTTTTKSQMNDGKKDNPTSEAKANSEGLSGKEENLSVNPTPATKHREVTPERYPDIIDIAGMDYSPARRKPPIHN